MPNSYYQLKKHLYRERYYENKRKEQENYELFKKYGGEKEYYRQQYIKAGFYIGGGPPVATGAPAITLARDEPIGTTDCCLGTDIGALDKDGGATLLETEPVVTDAFLAGTAGLDGLTATDFWTGTDVDDGATPVVG